MFATRAGGTIRFTSYSEKIMAEDVEEMVGGLPTKGDDTREMKHAKGWRMI